MRWNKVRWLVGTACILMGATTAVAIPTTATAATTYSHTYNVSKCMYLPGVGTYVTATMSGTIWWNMANGPTQHFPVAMYFANVKITNPSISVSTRTSCARTATFVTRSGADVTQGFYADQCSANAGLAVSVPWGISVSPTYSCSRIGIGDNTTHYGKANKWVQNNSGAPVHWTKYLDAGPSTDVAPWPCIDMSMSITIHQSTNVSDTAAWGDNESLHALTC